VLRKFWRFRRSHRVEQHLVQGRAHHHARASSGRLLHYGVREFGMTAIMNGISLHVASSLRRTFLVFSDYARNAVRLGC